MNPDANAIQFLSALLQQVQAGRVRVTDYRIRSTSSNHEVRIRYVPAKGLRPCACAAPAVQTRGGWLCPECGAEWQDEQQDGEEGHDAHSDADDQGAPA